MGHSLVQDHFSCRFVYGVGQQNLCGSASFAVKMISTIQDLSPLQHVPRSAPTLSSKNFHLDSFDSPGSSIVGENFLVLPTMINAHVTMAS